MMFSIRIFPRFCDTDALGHINNCAITEWFEEGRRPVFEIFTPNLNVKEWKLIVARLEVDFLAQTNYGVEVELRTEVLKLGTSSFHLRQSVWQGGFETARAKVVMVHYGYELQKSLPLEGVLRSRLEEHLVK